MPGAKFALRRMRADDYPEVAEVWEEARLPYQANGRDSRERVLEQLSKESSIFLVAEADGTIIGTLLATHDARKGWLNRLAVRICWQGQGVASALVRRAEEELHVRGIMVFSVLIHADNSASRRLFSELGYKEHDDVVYLSKRLEQHE
ncbi:MAG: GNAT family N-acetyltransferase [Methanomassiliicoccales archaeon]|nr:GNAT family N-acetyltransferase [Methanomassiliicoccales archaeon]